MAAKKRGRGRPKMRKSERRMAMFHIRVTDQEYKAICKAADLSGMTVSEFVRPAVLQLATRQIAGLADGTIATPKDG